jgi:hypothetical protein
MFIRNGQRRPETNADLQRWIDIADTVANSVPTTSGYSPHELLFALRRIVSIAALVPDDMLAAVADIGSDATADLVSQIRLHQAALAVLDEARQDARIQQRAAIERAHGQQHAAPHVWQRGDLVLARTPRALRDGDDKLNSRLEFSGVWSVMSHDPVTERVVLQLTIPVPTSSAVDGPQIRTLDDTNTITVHSSDVRSFHDGSPLDSTHTVSPLHIGVAPPALNTPWHAPFTASDADARRAHGADDRAPSRCQASSHARTGASHFGQPRPRDSSVRSTRSTRSATSCGGGCSGRRGRALVCNSDRRSRTGGPFTNYVYTCATLDDHCIDKHTHYTFEQSVQRAQTVLLHRRLSRPVRPDRRHL